MRSGAEMIVEFFKNGYENKTSTQEDIENLVKTGAITEEEKKEIIGLDQEESKLPSMSEEDW